MIDGFAAVVPTLGGARHGKLRPAPNARYGLLLIEDRGILMPALQRVYDELELYLQAAGITLLRLTRPSSDHAASVVEILAGISTLRSHGLSRILIITSTADASISSAAAAAAARDSFLEVVVEHAAGMPHATRTIEGLIATVREAADSVAGVAILVCHPPASTPALRVMPRQEEVQDDLTEPDTPHSTIAQTGRTPPHRLFVPYPSDVSSVVATVSSLYTWAITVVRAENQTAAMPAADWSGPPSADPCWQETSQWLEEQWLTIADAFAKRAPERAKRMPAYLWNGAGGTVDASMHAARCAWRYLDRQAREEWLTACSHVFAFMAERAGILARRQTDLRAHG